MSNRSSCPIFKTLLFVAALWIVVPAGAVLAQDANPQDTDSTKTSTPPNSITGRVVTQSGQPVINATVSVTRLNSPAPPRPVPAANDGSFKVAGLQSGLYRVSASAASYIPVTDDYAAATSNYYQLGDSVTITMIKGGVISGTVTGSDGEPVVAVRVRALMVRDANGQQPAISQTMERLTDDRGIYRLYGLLPGTYVVSAGGGSQAGFGGAGAGLGAGGGPGFGGRFGGFGGGFGGGGFGGRAFGGPATAVYDRDSPTFAPSSTRDTATEITVNPGDETADVNIKYRGESGHAISGIVKASPGTSGSYSAAIVTLTRANRDGEIVATAVARGSAFVFYGVANGDYELSAISSIGPDSAAASQPVHVTVMGSNATGVVLTTNPLASISGRVVLEPSAAQECKSKQPPRFEEILVSTTRTIRKNAKELPVYMRFSSATAGPGKNGEFLLGRLAPGQYRFNASFFAKDWYLRAVTLPSAAVSSPLGRGQQTPQNAANRTIDVARNGVALKLGSRVTGMLVNLAGGAASIRGSVTAENAKLPQGLFVYLVPQEREQAENVLRYFVAPVASDGSFKVEHLAPGLYWIVARQVRGRVEDVLSNLRAAEAAQERLQLRRDAEAAKRSLELKSCEDLSDYPVPLQ